MTMSVAQLQHAILALPRDDYFALLRWFADSDMKESCGDIDVDAEWARHEAQRAIAEDAIQRGVLLDLSFETYGRPAWAVSERAGSSSTRSRDPEAAVLGKTAKALQKRCMALPKDEFCALLYWFLEYDNDFWDRQMEEDAAAGKWDAWAREAGEAAKRGELFDIPS